MNSTTVKIALYTYHMPKHHYSSSQTGFASRFICRLEGQHLVVCHPSSNPLDMLILRDLSTGKDLSHPVNVEQLVVVPNREIMDLQSDNCAVVEINKALDPLSCTLLHLLFHIT